MSQYIVISLKHTKKRHKAITLWQANDSGYCWKLETAGLYKEADVLERLGYYNSGCSNIAVPVEVVRELCQKVEYENLEFGVCLPNNASTWSQLLGAVIRTAQYEPKPEYRGAKAADNSLWVKRQRCDQVNQAIKIIGDHGRRFFYDAVNQRYACLEVDQRGKVWIVDDYTGKRIYTHPTTWGNRWRGFNHGGTLRSLVEQFRDYITTGKQFGLGWLGPERFGDSNVWGYEDDAMKAVRDQAGALPVFRQPLAAAA